MFSRLSLSAGLLLAMACAGAGSTDTYASVGDAPITMEFKAGGAFTMAAAGLGSSSGTYTVEGEKLIVSVEGQTHTFIRDGNCIEERRQIFGKLCKGGKAGEASNVSTRNVPTTPTGSYLATNADGEFRLQFLPGNRLALTATPPGGAPDTKQGTFIVEGDAIHATLDQSMQMVLRFVNDTYESTAFGLPLKFVKQ